MKPQRQSSLRRDGSGKLIPPSTRRPGRTVSSSRSRSQSRTSNRSKSPALNKVTEEEATHVNRRSRRRRSNQRSLSINNSITSGNEDGALPELTRSGMSSSLREQRQRVLAAATLKPRRTVSNDDGIIHNKPSKKKLPPRHHSTQGVVPSTGWSRRRASSADGDVFATEKTTGAKTAASPRRGQRPSKSASTNSTTAADSESEESLTFDSELLNMAMDIHLGGDESDASDDVVDHTHPAHNESLRTCLLDDIVQSVKQKDETKKRKSNVMNTLLTKLLDEMQEPSSTQPLLSDHSGNKDKSAVRKSNARVPRRTRSSRQSPVVQDSQGVSRGDGAISKSSSSTGRNSGKTGASGSENSTSLMGNSSNGSGTSHRRRNGTMKNNSNSSDCRRRTLPKREHSRRKKAVSD